MPDHATRSAVLAAVEARSVAHRDVSAALFADPETAFQEHRARDLLCAQLSDCGFDVTTPAGGMDTAFVGRWGSGSTTVGFILEYDALPGLGHACGHNLVAACGLTAAIALARALPSEAVTVAAFGTPAEEGGGGKVIGLEAGMFDGADAIMMCHPLDRTVAWRASIASIHLKITFRGRAAHAARAPEEGRNALDGLLLFFAAVNALRQHIPDRARLHGVITKGGDAPNVVPDYTEATFLVREVSSQQARYLADRVRACADGAALATGTTVEVEETSPLYSERKNNHVLADRAAGYLTDLGLAVEEGSRTAPAGSSDFSNVSLALPALGVFFQITPRGVGNHTVDFREAAAAEAAHSTSLTVATALALVGADVATDPVFLAAVRDEFATAEPDYVH